MSEAHTPARHWPLWLHWCTAGAAAGCSTGRPGLDGRPATTTPPPPRSPRPTAGHADRLDPLQRRPPMRQPGRPAGLRAIPRARRSPSRWPGTGGRPGGPHRFARDRPGRARVSPARRHGQRTERAHSRPCSTTSTSSCSTPAAWSAATPSPAASTAEPHVHLRPRAGDSRPAGGDHRRLSSSSRRRARRPAPPCCPTSARSTWPATWSACAWRSATAGSPTWASPTAPCSDSPTPRCSPPTCGPWCSTASSTPP